MRLFLTGANSLRPLGPDQWALHVPLGKLQTERLLPVDSDTRQIITRIHQLRANAQLAFLATGKDDVITPFENVADWESAKWPAPSVRGWQFVDGFETRLKHDRMEERLLRALRDASSMWPKTEGTSKVDQHRDNLQRLEVILQCVRSRMDRRAKSIGHVMQIMSLFWPSSPDPASPRVSAENTNLEQLFKRNAQHYGNQPMMAEITEQAMQILVGKPVAGPIKAVFRDRLASFLERIDSLGNREYPSLRVTGGRDALVGSLLAFLDALKEGDCCKALTSPTIWLEENLGPSSRTSSMLQLIRLRRVHLKWVIVLRSGDIYRQDVQRVLAFRCEDERTIAGLMPSAADGFRYYPVTDDHYERIFRAKKSFIAAEIGHDNSTVVVAPDFSSRNGRLAALTYWNVPRRTKELMENFNECWGKALPARYFERTL